MKIPYNATNSGELQVPSDRPYHDSNKRSDNPRKLTHGAYTVAWICALACELTASLAVLDKVHADLDNPLGDHNVYCYGEIAGHNIVLTCLPAGVYGTTSAARVGERLCRTFESIKVPLMVGIGGGVPSSTNDIRLGDVVVSVPTSSPACGAVVQYDCGKVISKGRFIRTGTLNKPAAILLSAITKLRSINSLHQSGIPSIIETALRSDRLCNQNFAYPGSHRDILFETTCAHENDCRECHQSGLIEQTIRKPRTSDSPSIFYGPIASGNSVIKNGRVRNAIAQPLGILCFEMEAAGLMDSLPCLVIRGIADYCDAYKTKEFQHYASLTAAAFAKELLLVVPKTRPVREDVHQFALESLQFEAASDRLMAIKPAHPETCGWILSDPTYVQWMDDSKLGEHHGLLWIKGKPGTGKSTLMKYALEQATAHFTILSFFFNARGKTELEKSTSGLYRSLLFQLFKLHPELQQNVDWFIQPSSMQRWNLNILQNMFVSAIRTTGKRPIICYIDALDESTESEIREMVDVFDQLGKLTASSEILLRVCYSSRYYPSITMKTGLEIKLDQRDNHWQDMKIYIDSELQIRSMDSLADLKADILARSAGIFLWVVLVVRILRKEVDCGRVHTKNLSNKLQQMPTKLSDLFREIIHRDDEDLDQFLRCLQWLLYTSRPLSPVEFYYGMLASEPTNTLMVWDWSTVTFDDMTRFISSISKGLAESTTSKQDSKTPLTPINNAPSENVQFIHESVREFLLQTSTMLEIWPGFEALNEGTSHDLLGVCCYQYLDRVGSLEKAILSSNHNAKDKGPRQVLHAAYPFMTYAEDNFLGHLDKALSCGNVSGDYIEAIVSKPWWDPDTILLGRHSGVKSERLSLLAIAVRKDYEALAISLLERGAETSFIDIDGQTLLHFAADNGSVNIMKTLLASEAAANDIYIEERNLMQLGSSHGLREAFEPLINAGTHIDTKDANGWTPLHYACFKGNLSTLR